MQVFEYTYDGIHFKGRLALPPGPGPHPGVMVMHDGRGVGEFVCQRARDLAAIGYAALATDMYGEGRQFNDPAQGTPAVIALRKDGVSLRERVIASF